MPKHILSIALILSFWANQTYGQVNFRPAYIINNDGDTLKGMVDYRKDERMNQSCAFKLKRGKKQIYLPGEIEAFRFVDHRYFVSKTVRDQAYFLELLVEGELSIYYAYYDAAKHYFFRKGSGNLVELLHLKSTGHIDNKGRPGDNVTYKVEENVKSQHDDRSRDYTVASLEYKDQLSDSLQLDSYLKAEVQLMNDLNHYTIIRFAQKYNAKRGGNKKVIVYHKSNKKKYLMASAGLLKMSYKLMPSEKIHTLYGINFYAPLTSNNLYLGFGFHYAQIDFEAPNSDFQTESMSYSIFKVPLSVRYQYSGNIVCPHASLGVNLYAANEGEGAKMVQDLSPSYAIGLAVKAYKNMLISCQFEGDFMRDPDYNTSGQRSFSQTISIGLMTGF